MRSAIVGDVHGQFVDVLGKLSKLHAKNAFAFAIIAGDLFADPAQETDAQSAAIDQLLQGKIEVPLPVYFALGRTPLPPRIIEKLEANNGEICENLIFLGKRTTIKTSEEIRIVALGGVLDPNIDVATSKDCFTPLHSNGDANSLKGAATADLLVTSEWPENILRGSKTVSDGFTPGGLQQNVAELCAALKPRYHFTTSPTNFWERTPFFHAPEEGGDPSDGYRVTRFISLAPFGNTSKQKWIYAFSLDPAAPNPLTIPTGTTASPLTAPAKKRQALDQQGQEFSRYSGANTYGNDSRPYKKRRGAKHAPLGPENCFFCLSNEDISTHLITSIGESTYMTTAKGPLTTSDTYSDKGLEFPAHMLIIPLAHSATVAAIPDPKSRKETLEEMQRFKNTAHKMLSTVSDGKLGTVTWEVCRSQGIHTHWQLLPVPIDLIRRGLVEAAFKVEAENDHYPPFQVSQDDDADDHSDRFDVWISSADAERADKKMSLSLSFDFRFDVQFPRRVMAKLLGLEKRMHWRDCAQSVEDETGDAERWKMGFKEYDFTLTK